jgi:hypothetical protein
MLNTGMRDNLQGIFTLDALRTKISYGKIDKQVSQFNNNQQKRQN